MLDPLTILRLHFMNKNNITNALLAGVIGDPIAHSKSPLLHNYWLKKYCINGYYIPIHVKTSNLRKNIEALIELGFRGINVTIPHKERVLSMADIVTDRASLIGAANTLYFSANGTITADNTDSYGFRTNIHHYSSTRKLNPGHAVVFGAGGAAKAVVHALLEEGMHKIKILNRTKAKAITIAEKFGKKIEVIDWYATEEALKYASIVINTTSLGMCGQPSLKLNLENVASNALITDLVYNPIETEILTTARRNGLQTIDGLGMLLYQAELGFQNWYNVKPEVNTDLRAFILKSLNTK